MSRRSELLHAELSDRINRCQTEVHRELGGGFLESAYREAMAIALADAGVACQQERPLTLYFRGRVIGSYRLDLVVDEKIVLECKTSESLRAEHETQLRNYLKASGMELGMVLLFGSRAKSKRIIYTDVARSRAATRFVNWGASTRVPDDPDISDNTDAQPLDSRERRRRR